MPDQAADTELGDRPLADMLDEGRRVAAGAKRSGATLRIAGGVGIGLHCPSARTGPLARTYADIDVVGLSGERELITETFEGLGYEADKNFNLFQGDTRLLFWDTVNDRQVDVFLDRLEMCHTIDLRERLAAGDRTLALADLLLLKLQVVQTNRKDLLDVVALLADHPFTDDDSEINLAYLTGLTAGDWGLWRTTTTIAERVAEFAAGVDKLAPDVVATVGDRVQRYRSSLEASEKSRGWRMRARVGDRKRWYQLPEEVR